MKSIRENLKEFLLDLKAEKRLWVSPRGEYAAAFSLWAEFKDFMGWGRCRWVEISRGLRAVFEQVEAIPVAIDLSSNPLSSLQPYDSNDLIESAQWVLAKLDGASHPKASEEAFLLRRDLVAFLYRIEGQNGGWCRGSGLDADYASLKDLAQEWKSDQIVFPTTRLTAADCRVLRDACGYPEFVKLIQARPIVAREFFEWALRDGIGIQPFIEYPSLARKLKEYDLTGRIGRLGGHFLKVVKVHPANAPEGIVEKIVTLPFEGRDVNILDETRYVLFRGNYALTIRQVFEEFAKKRYGASNLEFMADGIINWNSFYWGWWNQDAEKYELVDLDKDEWWKDLPLLQVLSLKEARERFGSHLDGRQWNVAAVATRERATLDFEGAHAYTNLAVPLGNGRYATYIFGKFATKFPSTLIQALMNIGHTSDATVVYPDENTYYTHRQRSRYSFAVDERQGKRFLESVKQDMLLARAGNFVYQIESENCAKWAHHKIEELVGPHRMPNVFQMPFLHSEPHGFMERVFAWVKFFPEHWQVTVTLFIHLLLGSHKGVWIWEEGKRVWKALTHHPFWSDTVIYHPSMLHRQQEKGIIRLAVAQGVTFTKEHIDQSYHQLYHKMVLFKEYVVNSAIGAYLVLMSLLEGFLHIKKKILAPYKGTVFHRLSLQDQQGSRVLSSSL